MKKRLEAELISIAHRILKLKNISELKQLHLEAQKLYETLSVLKFVEENINIIQPKIDINDIELKLENNFVGLNEILAFANEEIIVKENKVSDDNIENSSNKNETYNKVEIPIIANDANIEATILDKNEEIIVVANENTIKEEPILMPEIIVGANNEIEEEIIIDENEPIFIPEFKIEKSEIKSEPVQISFDEFKFVEPVFEKKSDVKEDKPVILNEKLSKGINIGLNDKVAFVKHLFNDSNEDYVRVLSQISTFDSYLETVNFINDFVKPDYNNWNEKDEYVLRFMEAVEKKFV
jgi:hypothetical protein